MCRKKKEEVSQHYGSPAFIAKNKQRESPAEQQPRYHLNINTSGFISHEQYINFKLTEEGSDIYNLLLFPSAVQ